MKKRLLSAALALAMVLTMLPLTALPAFATYSAKTDVTSATVYYYAKGVQFKDAGGTGTATESVGGWYTKVKVEPATSPVQYTYTQKTDGLVNTTNATASSATWYSGIGISNTDTKINSLGLTNITLLTNLDLYINEMTTTGTINVNVNGHTLTLDEGGSADKATGLKVIDTFVPETGPKTGAVTGDITIKGRNFTFTNGNTNGSDAVKNPTGTVGVDLELDNSSDNATIGGKTGVDCTKLSNTLTVYNYGGTVGDITTKMAKANITVNQNGVVGEVTLGDGDTTGASSSASKSGGSIKADDATVGNITVIGTVSISGTNTASLGAISVLGGNESMNPTDNTKIPTWKGMDLTLDGYSSVESVTQQTGDKIGHSVMLKGGSSITKDLVLNKAGTSSVTLQGGARVISSVHMTRGTLKLDNGKVFGSVYQYNGTDGVNVGAMAITVSKGSEMGALAFGDTGDRDIVPSLSIDGGTVGAYPTSGVSVTMTKNGGTVGSQMDEKNMDKSLRDGYEIEVTGTGGAKTYTYTTVFQDLIDAWESSGVKIIPVGDPARTDSTITPVEVTFEWNEVDPNASGSGSSTYVTLTELSVTANKWITLPTTVQKQTVQYWYDSKDVTNKGIAAGSLYQVTEATTLQVKQVQAGKNLITKVSAFDGSTPIGCTISGNTINLSGAVAYSNGASLTLQIEIDGDATKARTVSVGWEKSGAINVGVVATSNPGVTKIADNKIKVYDTEYVITGNGLGEMKDWIEITPNIAAVPVVVPSESAGLSGSYVGLGKEIAVELAKGTVNFNGAAGLKAQLNAMINSLSQSTIDGYVKSACSALAAYENKRDNVTTHKAEHYYQTYAKVIMTPFFELSISNYTPVVGKNPTFTLNITPKVRYTVVNASYQEAIKEKDKNGKEVPWSQVVSLSVPNNDWGTVVLTLPIDNTKVSNLNLYGTSYAHHEGYVYPVAWGSANTLTTVNGFSAYTFNTDDGGFSITKADGSPINGEPKYTFETLQDAVDAVKNGQVIKCGENFNGSINVSGAARTFTVQAMSGKQVYLTGVNGANATYKTSSVGSSYTVQLSTDTAVAGSAAISVGTANNGTATVNLTSARAGSTVTITVNPSSGYRAVAPTVKTNTGAAVSVTAGANNTYTFVVPDGATSITVTPSFVQNTGLPFTDVAANAWYFDGVAYCYNNNLMQGYDGAATTFGINHAVTRAEVVTILWRLAGQPIETPRTTYTDVKSGEWHYNAISWATNHGYAKGYGDGRFGPNNPVQRQELVVFLHRYADEPTVNSNLGAYSDGGGVESWAMAAMRWATSYSILSGTNSVSLNGRLNAYSTAYREQVAVTLQHYHQYYK